MDELFGKGRPSGTRRKHQSLMHFGSGFELVNGLPDLCDEILAIVDRSHHVYAKWFQTQIPTDEFSNQWRVNGDSARSMRVSEMFPGLEAT